MHCRHPGGSISNKYHWPENAFLSCICFEVFVQCLQSYLEIWNNGNLSGGDRPPSGNVCHGHWWELFWSFSFFPPTIQPHFCSFLSSLFIDHFRFSSPQSNISRKSPSTSCIKTGPVGKCLVEIYIPKESVKYYFLDLGLRGYLPPRSPFKDRAHWKKCPIEKLKNV